MSTQVVQHDPYEWHQEEAGVWTRTCVGQEASASFNENIADGHTELSMTVTFRLHHSGASRLAGAQLELDELVARVREAWIRTRFLRPEIAVEMDRHANPAIPQTFRYRALSDEQSLRRWVEQTLVVLRLGEPGVSSYEEVEAFTYNRPLPTEGKMSMLYLILAAPGSSDRTAHLIWNVAHAVTDGGSIVEMFNVLLQCVVDAAPSPSYDSVYMPKAEELDVYARLPRSTVTVHQKQYKPTPRDVEQAVEAAQANARLIADKIGESLALTPAASWNKRSHETICIVRTLDALESHEVLKFAKSVKSGVTYLASAATMMATAETYPERKVTSSGALMGMVRNVRRWLSREFLTPLGSDAVFVWIPVNTRESLEPEASRLPALVSAAHRIQYELDQHLTTAHCIASLPYVAEGAICGLTEQWARIEAANQATPSPTEEELAKIVGPQAPGFSSVGVFKVLPRFEPRCASARESALWLERIDCKHLGRQVNASPWMSMLTIDGKLRFQLGFDRKFHEPEKMEQLMARTIGWMRVCASAAGLSRIDSYAVPVSARL